MQNRVKIRHFEAAIALAEELNYSRAATRIKLSQSGLTRCIQSIERETNSVLFKRTTGRVEITEAGRVYVEQARLALTHGERALNAVRDIRVISSSILHVGTSPDIDPILIEILYAVRLPLYPSLRLTLDSGSSMELSNDLMSAQLDIGLITRPDQNSKLTMVRLLESPLFVVLSSDHPCAGMSSLKLSDLDGNRLVMTDRRAHPVLYRRIVDRMHEEGCSPKGVDHISYADEAISFINAAGGVALLPKAQALRFTSDRYIVLPLNEDDLCLDEQIVARADNESKLLSDFVRAYVTRATSVLRPLQLSLAIDGRGSDRGACR